jgi:dTDP-4-dehydrorhamnose reductase
LKILVLGNKGMLGTSFMKLLSEEASFNVIGLDIDKLDISDQDALSEAFLQIKPDLVINCAAYTDVDGCESNQEAANKVNGEAVESIARECEKSGAILIHFSTDYVFDGKKETGYSEDDAPSPINAYGESKLLAEKMIQENMKRFYILRTSWLYGANGKNFVKTMLKLGREKNEIEVVNDQIGSPTYSDDLAGHVVRNFLNGSLDFGIYHATNEGTCSWFDFAVEIFKITEQRVNVLPINSEKFSRPAKRPHFSSLINAKSPKFRGWQEALSDYLL